MQNASSESTLDATAAAWATKPDAERIAVSHVLILSIIHALAIVALFHFSWEGLAFLVIGHFLTGCLGISVGFHRLLSHQAFKAHPIARGILAFFGTLAFQGGPLTWSAFHRVHHSSTDRPGDPHSSLRGFLWSHLLWMLYKNPNGFSRRGTKPILKDLEASAWLRFLDRNLLWINLGAALLFWAYTGRADWTLWAFPLRIVSLWHCTWFVNSVAHGAPLKPKADTQTNTYQGDTWRNVWWVALLTYGEGWHANHHIRPKSWTFKREWYQVDPGAWIVRGLRLIRAAR